MIDQKKITAAANAIVEAHKNNKNLRAFAVRADLKTYHVGDDLPDSHNWVDGEMTDEWLPGTCGTGISTLWLDDVEEVLDALEEAIVLNKDYHGKRYIIGGSYKEYGSDEGEWIISDAEIVFVLDNKVSLG